MWLMPSFELAHRGSTHKECFFAARCNWHWWSSIFWGSVRFLPESSWPRWKDHYCCWSWWWLLEVFVTFIYSHIWYLFPIEIFVVNFEFLDRRSFGSVLDIIPLADSVTKLTAQCELCGKRAYFTLRKTDETQTELIGGADVYMPVCRQHYVSGQGVIEAARMVLQQKLQCG